VTGVVAYDVVPIGWVRSSRTEPIDDDWDSVTAEIELDAERFGADALAGLGAFSHVQVGFVFDRARNPPVRQPAWSHELMTTYRSRS
jgi:tRNA (Thr-GGU) A37 N-methylase